jgi:hypothetical protein
MIYKTFINSPESVCYNCNDFNCSICNKQDYEYKNDKLNFKLTRKSKLKIILDDK